MLAPTAAVVAVNSRAALKSGMSLLCSLCDEVSCEGDHEENTFARAFRLYAVRLRETQVRQDTTADSSFKAFLHVT